MLFSHPPAAPGASQGAPVAWLRENPIDHLRAAGSYDTDMRQLK